MLTFRNKLLITDNAPVNISLIKLRYVLLSKTILNEIHGHLKCFTHILNLGMEYILEIIIDFIQFEEEEGSGSNLITDNLNCNYICTEQTKIKIQSSEED